MDHNSHLTSAEMGNFWNIYMANSLSHQIIAHFLSNAEERG